MQWRLPHFEADAHTTACHLVAAGRFALRCAGSAALAYLLASTMGLPRPIWATVSALVVCQDTFQATRGSVYGRIGGTLLGALLALGTEWAGDRLGIPVTAQIAIMVGLAGLIAQRHVPLRAALWTGPIILLTNAPGETIVATALYRTTEVVLGALVGMLLPLIENLASGAFNRHAAPPNEETLQRRD